MKVVYTSELDEQREFVDKAAKAFSMDPKWRTYGDIEPGSYFAVRWGGGNDCVLLLRLDEYFEPIIFGQVIDMEARDD